MKSPLLSVTLITPDIFKSVEKTLSYLAEQTICEGLEIIIVCPYLNKLEPDESILVPFSGYKFVELGDFTSTGQSMAAGFLSSTSPVVAYCEEHSYPEPGWAETIVARHSESWDVVGWSVANYNPHSLIGWACLYTDFGKCVEPRKSHEKCYLAGHHISYKRNIIIKYKDSIGNLLENEAVFLRLLNRKNYRIYFEASVKSYHTNVSRFYSFLKSEYFGGKQFTSAIVSYEGFPVHKRVFFALLTPFRPMTKMCGIVRDLVQTGRMSNLYLPILPILIPALIVNAAGEFFGYISGLGDSSKRRLDIELRRYRN